MTRMIANQLEFLQSDADRLHRTGCARAQELCARCSNIRAAALRPRCPGVCGGHVMTEQLAIRGEPGIRHTLAPFSASGTGSAGGGRGYPRRRAVALHRGARRGIHGWAAGPGLRGQGRRVLRRPARARCQLVDLRPDRGGRCDRVEPGDEVITTPWTMAATATAILHWNRHPGVRGHDPRTSTSIPRASRQG